MYNLNNVWVDPSIPHEKKLGGAKGFLKDVPLECLPEGERQLWYYMKGFVEGAEHAGTILEKGWDEEVEVK